PGFAGWIVELQYGFIPTPPESTSFAVVQGIPVMRSGPRVEPQPPRSARGCELHALGLRLAGGPGVDGVLVGDLQRHPAVAETADGDDRTPPPVRQPGTLHFIQSIIDQHRAVQPLPEQPAQVLARDLLAYGAEL